MTSNEMLKKQVEDYATTLEQLVDGTYPAADDVGESDYDLSNTYDRLSWYFQDVLDVEYHTDAQLRYKGAVITLACGGPAIYYDTWSGKIRGYWGFDDEFSWEVDSNTRNEIDEYWEEIFDMLR